MSPTIAEALSESTRFLKEAEVPEPQLNSQILLAHAIGSDRTHLIINFNQQVNPDESEQFWTLVRRRAEGEPVQYITGVQEFYGLEFEVNRSVLIPRPETELIVEEVAGLAPHQEAQLLIDVGTGSGCLAIALARELPLAKVIATDISNAALDVARRNADRLGVSERIQFLETDLLEGVIATEHADFIVSNPPYVAAHELPNIQREVRDWEPSVALTDFGDGLSFFRRLFDAAPSRLKRGGYLLCEMGFTQSEQVKALAEERPWSEMRFLDDLQGIPRTIVLRKSGSV